MQEMTGESYTSSDYAKALMVSRAKEGKSVFIIASLLGLLPWQKSGGVVSRPENLHVLTFDANALGGIKRFLTETCGASSDALKFNVYNMQEDLRRAGNDGDWDTAFYNGVLTSIEKAREKTGKGVHAIHFSSLTGVVEGLVKALAGPSAEKKGGGMDQSKWVSFGAQLAELRNLAQQDTWHCIWEGHIYKPAATGQDGQEKAETLQMPGKSGQNFPYNVEQIFRIKRQFEEKYKETRADLTYLDTQSSFDFVAGGRNFTEALNPKEYDMTKVFQKLGLKVGGWGASSAPVKKAKTK
jgi:hypothetical protein